MRCKVIVCIVAILASLFVGMMLSEQDVLAYYKDDCFAVQYGYNNAYQNNGKAAQDGNTSTDRTEAQAFSTNKYCLESGVIKEKGLPDDTKILPGGDQLAVKLKVDDGGKGITMWYCTKTGYACDNGTALFSKDYKLSDNGNDFKKLAEAILKDAPSKYGNADKGGLDESVTKTSEQKKAEEKLEDLKEGDNSTSEVTQKCENAGGAQSLGWIVCPIITWIGEAANNVYNKYVEPSLQVEPQLFTDSDSNLGEAWGTFQNIANIIFVILLLLVIFSQLTGVGIDNYGIKKILPKLIVAAILINLSYIICIVAVDLSNILGNGFQALFDGLGNGLDPIVNVEDSNLTRAEVVSTAGSLVGLGVLGALINMSGAIWEAPSVALSLFVSAIGVVVAVFFLFILLAAREAAIVVLTVISPVAIVCYMLPNTKKLFDKWLNAFKGLLLVYPICGLLVGGGNYVSLLLLSSGMNEGFFTALTAMITGVLPIFFIPLVLRNSFNALGNIGARIAGFGERARSGVTGAARRSNMYRGAQENAKNWTMRQKAGMDQNGNLTERGERKARFANSRFGRFIRADTRLARYGEATKKNIAEQEAAGAILSGALAQQGISGADDLDSRILGSGFRSKTEGAYYGRQFLNAAAAGDITRMNSAIQAMKNSNMKPKDIAKLLRYAESNNMIKGDANVLADWRGKLSNQYGNDFLATDAELGHYMKTRGAGTMEMEYGNYASNKLNGMNIDDLTPQEVPNLSGDSLAGMAASGLLTKGMAQRVLASNPNISEDKKIMLSAIANGTTVTNAADFKRDAEILMKNHSATVPTISGTTKEMVDAWVANNPQEVNVVQNFNAGGRQIEPVDARISHGTPPPRPDTNLGTGAGVDEISE